MLLYICYKEFSGYDCIKLEQWKLSGCKLCVFMIGMSMVQKVIGQCVQRQAVNGKLEACYLCDGSLKKPKGASISVDIETFPSVVLLSVEI